MKNLKKLLIVLAAVILASGQMNVQSQAFQTGSMVANLGAGFGWYSYGYGATSLPALSLSVEKGIKDLDFGTLSVGGIVGFKHASYKWISAYDFAWNDIIVAARGGIHMDLLKNEKIDTYGGIAAGLRFETESYYNWVPPYGANDYKKVHESTAHPLFAFYVGGRYYFTNKLAGFGELGYGLGYFTLGLSYKIK
jgi:hypothetical protein